MSLLSGGDESAGRAEVVFLTSMWRIASGIGSMVYATWIPVPWFHSALRTAALRDLCPGISDSTS